MLGLINAQLFLKKLLMVLYGSGSSSNAGQLLYFSGRRKKRQYMINVQVVSVQYCGRHIKLVQSISW